MAAYHQALSLPDTLEAPAASVHNNLGLAFHQQGKWKEAIEEFKQAVQLDPNYVEAEDNLKKAQQQLKKQR
ncbi:tetratricopeptide repeat protein [Trichocoleus sp. FACHB-90]|uniref:tetratricopeptide repeat protein n=1 Tax=Cyanophyceae TaxID=3028117 RepID=UPI00322025A9